MIPHYLYKISNSVNDKLYIGKTIDPHRRWREHRVGKTGCHKLVNAMKKHGKENFTFEIITIGSEDYIAEMELKAISHYDTITMGYNIHYGSEIVSDRYPEMYKEPVCVAGFWFPCAKLALKVLRMSARTYKRRKLLENLHLESERPVKMAVAIPDNMWDIHVPWGGELFSEKKRLAMLGKNAGEKNGMFGRKNTSRSRKIRIHGIEYPSISEAVRQTSYTKSMIEKRLAKKIAGFEYVIPQEN